MILHLAEGLALPAEAVTRTFGFLGVRGAGKSNTAVVMDEEIEPFPAGARLARLPDAPYQSAPPIHHARGLPPAIE